MLRDVRGLALVYAALLEKLDLTGVTVVGNSIGGWIAAELAVISPSRLKGVVLVSATGIEVAGHPVADVFKLTPDELSRLSYHEPERFRIDPAALPPERRAAMAANRAALAVYGGSGSDPTLRARLSGIKLPALLLWGASDRIVDTTYGRTYADAISGATFRVLPGTGHVPQIETPELLAGEVMRFVDATAQG
jgi:pimeloyl-ACP methyl ester carboxylesterase